jgi:hypothetical protein
MNKPFQPRDRSKWLKRHGFTNGLWRLEERSKAAKERTPDAWEKTQADYDAANAAVKAEALKIIAEIRAGSRNPFGPLLARLNRNYQTDHQFDNDRERDEQGKPKGEPLWP